MAHLCARKSQSECVRDGGADTDFRRFSKPHVRWRRSQPWFTIIAGVCRDFLALRMPATSKLEDFAAHQCTTCLILPTLALRHWHQRCTFHEIRMARHFCCTSKHSQTTQHEHRQSGHINSEHRRALSCTSGHLQNIDKPRPYASGRELSGDSRKSTDGRENKYKINTKKIIQ